ncbi:ABC transporter permease [Ideonella sp. YS5]|uniref:ABC transporter permease n=1 Tax=Ideonella sp. YS5 TaxID=3453714 RepID=UPI003EE9E6DE
MAPPRSVPLGGHAGGAVAAPRAPSREVRKANPAWSALVSIALCLVLWHVAAAEKWHLGVVTFENVPTPIEVAHAAGELMHSPKLVRHLSSSLQRIGWGFGLAALIGVGLGLVIGRSAWARHTLLPPLEVLRPIPAVAWIPLAVLMFPSSEGSMVFITGVGALFPILLATIHGVEGVDARLLASARSLGCRGWRLFAEVVLPAAAPSIVTGLAIGMGTCWFCLVSAEMISGQFGIGYYTWESYTVQNYANIIVGMLLIGVLGMGSSALLRAAGRRAMPWHRPLKERR